MAERPRIGLACPVLRERATLPDWLHAAGYEPVPMIDSSSVARELEGEGFEALIIDADLTSSSEAASVLRTLGKNRPIIVIGDFHASKLSDPARREVMYLARPVSRDELLLTITLALAEGRPARRSPRRTVARLQSTIDGVSARLIDVSYEGIRIELPERHRSTLPPFFTVRVPMFNVSVIGQRVWLASSPELTARSMFWFGVRLARNPEQAVTAWRSLVEHAPASTALKAEAVNYL
jgi:hypothetical protein